jgi:triacylglycerol lipase
MVDQDADQIVAAAGGANPLAVAMLQLCQISYDASGIRKAIGNLPPFPGVPGKWYPLWGPAWNLIDSNLAFVAGYYRDGASSPLFTAVVTRGTDVDIWDPLGILWQVWEDLDPENPVPLPWPNNEPDAWIAGGTADGLGVIQSVTWNGSQLKDWLTNFLAQPGNSSTFLIVTGHSLGGCLTSVVAPWLKATLPKAPAMLPMTFAAPSAGNAAFAGAFTRMFPASYRGEGVRFIRILARSGGFPRDARVAGGWRSQLRGGRMTRSFTGRRHASSSASRFSGRPAAYRPARQRSQGVLRR